MNDMNNMNNKKYNKINITRKIIAIATITILTSLTLTACNAIERTAVEEQVDITYWEPEATTTPSQSVITEPSEEVITTTTPISGEPITTTSDEATEEQTEATTEVTTEEVTEPEGPTPPAPEHTLPTPPAPELTPPAPPEVTEATTTTQTEPPAADLTDVQTIVNTATAQIGTPFVQGGDSAGGFDNSGFLYYVGKTVNSAFPRNIAGQITFADAVSVSYDELSEGDFVYFSGSIGGSASYGGVYIGDGYMVYASNPGTLIEKKNISTTYWKNHFACAIRLV